MKRHSFHSAFLLFTFSCIYRCTCFSQATDTTQIKNLLEWIRERDQKTRSRADSVAFVGYIDSTNLVLIEKLVQTYGWPGKSFVGPRGNNTCFLVIQHADSATQVRYFPIIKRSVESGESSALSLAMLEDRILMRQGKKQIYGSQVVFDAKGAPMFHPIEDEIHVNERRKAVGMQPIEEYAAFFGITYKPPAE